MEQQTQPMQTGAINHTEFVSENPDATQAFLGKVFGWTFEDVPAENPYTIVQNNGVPVGGIRQVTPDEAGPVTTPYVTVDDLDATTHLVEANGGSVLVPKTEVPGMGVFAWYTCPGGNVLACWQDTN